MQSALRAISVELGEQGINFSRGPESEISFRKEVEQLMHELSKHNINVPNAVLQRAIVMPKDNPKPAIKYPSVRS